MERSWPPGPNIFGNDKQGALRNLITFRCCCFNEGQYNDTKIDNAVCFAHQTRQDTEPFLCDLWNECRYGLLIFFAFENVKQQSAKVLYATTVKKP